MRAAVEPWRARALCLNLTTRGVDYWCPDESLPKAERRRQQEKAKEICAACPVMLDCAAAAIADLPRVDEHTIRGGMDPKELRQVAETFGLPSRRVAQHGTRSRYVAGCSDGPDGDACEPCKAAHRSYEHQRRLWAKKSGEQVVA